MEVVFATNALRRNYEDSGRANRQWGPEVGRKYISRVKELKAAKDFRQVYMIQSMGLHSLRGPRRGELSIRLTGAWRLIVTRGDTEESVIIKEVTNHYDD